MTEQKTTFEDFTIAETQLWGTNIGQPFSDYPHVFRSVITGLTSGVAQETAAKWYARWCDTETRPEMVEIKDKETGEYVFEWPAGLLLSIQSSYGKGLVCSNLCDWTADVVDEGDYASGIELRRAVTEELRKEWAAAGNWDLWLCHLGWVMQRRVSQRAGVAGGAWRDYLENVTIEVAKKAGIDAFTAFMLSKGKTGTAAEDTDEDDEGESPLGVENSNLSAAVAAV